MELAAFVDGDVQYVKADRSQGKLSYLERTTPDSAAVIVFLHGLGLDAYDYLPFLKRHKVRSAALNLYGFDERDCAQLEPVPLDQHVQLVSGCLNDLNRKHGGKKMVLVGFSLGADLILGLGEYWHENPEQQAELDAAILLDPNINHSTMSISARFARVASAAKINTAAVKQLIAEVPDNESDLLATICEYIGRIGTKDFRHIQRLSQDAVSYWQASGFDQYDQFHGRLKRVSEMATTVRVLLSAPYEPHFQHLLAGISEPTRIEINDGTDHFDLVRSDFLSSALRNWIPSEPYSRQLHLEI